MAPEARLERATSELTAQRIYHWATRELKIGMSIALRPTTHLGLKLATEDRSDL